MRTIIPSAFFLLVVETHEELLSIHIIRKSPLTLIHSHHTVFRDEPIAIEGTDDGADSMTVVVLGRRHLHVFRVGQKGLASWKHNVNKGDEGNCDTLAIHNGEKGITIWIGSTQTPHLRAFLFTGNGLRGEDRRKLAANVTALCVANNRLMVGTASGTAISVSAGFDKGAGLDDIPISLGMPILAIGAVEDCIAVLGETRLITTAGESLTLGGSLREALRSRRAGLHILDSVYINADEKLFKLGHGVWEEWSGTLFVGREEPWVIVPPETIMPLTALFSQRPSKGLSFTVLLSAGCICPKIPPCISERCLREAPWGTSDGVFTLAAKPDGTVSLLSIHVEGERVKGTATSLPHAPGCIMRMSLFGPVIVGQDGTIHVDGRECKVNLNTPPVAEVYKGNVAVCGNSCYVLDLATLTIQAVYSSSALPLVPDILTDSILFVAENVLIAFTGTGFKQMQFPMHETPTCGAYSRELMWLGGASLTAYFFSGYGAVGPFQLTRALPSRAIRIIPAGPRICYVLTEAGTVFSACVTSYRNALSLNPIAGLTDILGLEPAISSAYAAVAFTTGSILFLPFAPEGQGTLDVADAVLLSGYIIQDRGSTTVVELRCVKQLGTTRNPALLAAFSDARSHRVVSDGDDQAEELEELAHSYRTKRLAAEIRFTGLSLEYDAFFNALRERLTGLVEDSDKRKAALIEKNVTTGRMTEAAETLVREKAELQRWLGVQGIARGSLEQTVAMLHKGEAPFMQATKSISSRRQIARVETLGLMREENAVLAKRHEALALAVESLARLVACSDDAQSDSLE